MPIIQFHLLSGRTTEQKGALCAAVTQAVVSVLGVDKESVRILINDVPPDNFAVAGVTSAEKARNGSAGQLTNAGGGKLDGDRPFQE